MEERRSLHFIKFMGKRENNLSLAAAIEEAAGCNVTSVSHFEKYFSNVPRVISVAVMQQ